MPERPEVDYRVDYPDPREQDIMAGDRRISRPDSSLPDWEVPDTSYRAIPIVWFTGAFILHLIAVHAIMLVFSSLGALAVVCISALAAGAVGKWTWDRGMKIAGAGWRIATVVILSLNLLYVAAVAFGG